MMLARRVMAIVWFRPGNYDAMMTAARVIGKN